MEVYILFSRLYVHTYACVVEPGEHSFMESLIALLSPVRRQAAFLQRVNKGKSDILNMYAAPLHLFYTLPANTLYAIPQPGSPEF